jgi:hypothetical protein
MWLWNTFKILPRHRCISINQQFTSVTENNFAGKWLMECKQNKDVLSDLLSVYIVDGLLQLLVLEIVW